MGITGLLSNLAKHPGMRVVAMSACLVAIFVSAASAADTAVSVDRRDCSRLARHVPSPDVAYTPGVDARGRTVAPADLGGRRALALPDRFTIPITVDLADRLGIPARGDADYIAQFSVGTVTVSGDGRVAFNGVPLTDEEAAELAALCQRAGERQ